LSFSTSSSCTLCITVNYDCYSIVDSRGNRARSLLLLLLLLLLIATVRNICGYTSTIMLNWSLVNIVLSSYYYNNLIYIKKCGIFPFVAHSCLVSKPHCGSHFMTLGCYLLCPHTFPFDVGHVHVDWGQQLLYLYFGRGLAFVGIRPCCCHTEWDQEPKPCVILIVVVGWGLATCNVEPVSAVCIEGTCDGYFS
jgi:hypothetical protein